MAPNAFESGKRKSIPAVLIYVRYLGEVLMLHRNLKGSTDFHHGKWNGLGGKCEADESPLQAAVRELYEESGLKIKAEAFRSLGAVTFPNFKAAKKEDWVCFLFSVQLTKKQRIKKLKPTEGSLHWMPKENVMSLNLWPGDKYFLPYVLDEKAVMGTVWYKNGKVSRKWVTPV